MPSIENDFPIIKKTNPFVLEPVENMELVENSVENMESDEKMDPVEKMEPRPEKIEQVALSIIQEHQNHIELRRLRTELEEKDKMIQKLKNTAKKNEKEFNEREREYESKLESLDGQINKSDRKSKKYKEKYHKYSEIYTCVICFSEMRCCVFLPCSHMVTCAKCTEEVKVTGSCPMCLQKIVTVVNVFIN